MNNSFTFDKDAHAVWTDVNASEIASANGYTPEGITLTGVALTEDDTNDRASITWDNAQWTASGGSIGPSNGGILWNPTTADDTVIGFIDFGEAKTATDGGNFNVTSIEVRVT